ncbi:fasciclin domain-containing protein [Christiangramia sp. SM2212]|uniref:Fasciclin domain-containing protein n=1 Tax=Christiangramia sediminicola TaxID=3073267 RepID=A0ABU1EQT7_9FLAO|nr:fasciclin domain-containing protein [Christiangramia sp. SM2212]MDR5590756.1 fasciclin domain-containing protein [Christiangramia sp. SM2212]
MDFIFKNAKLTFLAFLVAFSLGACSEDDLFNPGGEMETITPDPQPEPEPEPEPTDDGEQSNTIVDFVTGNDDYSSLGAALEAAGLVETLDGDTEYTVFAPNNAAFDAFLETYGFESLDDVPVDLLTLVLMNHVQTGIVMSADLTTGYIDSMAEAGPDGENVSLYVNTSEGVTLNGMSTVTSADNEVDNGVIHAVDAVIGLPDVTTFAAADPTFSILAEALTMEELVATLQSTESPAPFTIFAPTDDAFAALLEELEITGLGDLDSETLAAVLQYHVITESNVTSDELSDGMMVTTLQGEDVSVGVGENVTITDVNERMATVTAPNVQATNGVIHVIDMVLLPTLE